MVIFEGISSSSSVTPCPSFKQLKIHLIMQTNYIGIFISGYMSYIYESPTDYIRLTNLLASTKLEYLASVWYHIQCQAEDFRCNWWTVR